MKNLQSFSVSMDETNDNESKKQVPELADVVAPARTLHSDNTEIVMR